jgi:hypothetical protein
MEDVLYLFAYLICGNIRQTIGKFDFEGPNYRVAGEINFFTVIGLLVK